MRQRKLESDADRYCDRDRCHSGGFYLGLCRLRGILSPPAPHDFAAGGPFYLPARWRCRRNRSTLRQRKKMESDAATWRQRPLQAGHSTRRHDSTAVIPDFRPRLANRCSQKVKTRAILASILDFRPRLANRCSQKAKTGANRASILDFKPRLANRCSQKAKTGAIRASILDFKPRLANRCSQKVKTEVIPPAQGLEHCAAPAGRLGLGNTALPGNAAVGIVGVLLVEL